MKHSKTFFRTLTLIALSSYTYAMDSEESLFKSKCSACHTMTRPQDKSNLVAPPVMGVMRHVKMTYPDKKRAVAFIKDYVLNPSTKKALCMPQKIKRFGLMPSQKGNVTQKELENIASWMFDNFPPKRFKARGNRKSCQSQ